MFADTMSTPEEMACVRRTERPQGGSRSLRPGRAGDRARRPDDDAALRARERSGRRRHLRPAAAAADPPGVPARRPEHLQPLDPHPDDLAAWRDVPGVEASPMGVSFVNAKRPGGSTVDIALIGVPEGSFLAPRPDAERALAGEPGSSSATPSRTTGVKVGDELTIVGVDRPLPVLGFTYAGSYGHVDIGFTSLSTWQSLLYGDNAKGRFSAIALRADDAASLDSAQARAAEATGMQVVTKKQSYAGSPGYTGETQTMTMIRWFLLVISALVVGAFFIVWTMQRSRQIAVLKALGASRAYVVRDAVGQLAVVLLVAAAVGGARGLRPRSAGRTHGRALPARDRACADRARPARRLRPGGLPRWCATSDVR